MDGIAPDFGDTECTNMQSEASETCSPGRVTARGTPNEFRSISCPDFFLMLRAICVTLILVDAVAESLIWLRIVLGSATEGVRRHRYHSQAATRTQRICQMPTFPSAVHCSVSEENREHCDHRITQK